MVLTNPVSSLKATPAPGQFLEGVVAVFAFGIQQRVGDGQGLRRQVVVTDNGVNAGFSRRGQRVEILGATIQGDDAACNLTLWPVPPLWATPIALAVTHGNVGEHRHLEPFEEGRHHGHRRRAIHVVVAVDHDALVPFNGFHDSGHGLVHVLHQEGIVEFVAVGVQKIIHFSLADHASLDQQRCNQRTQPRVLRQAADFGKVRGCGRLPFEVVHGAD